VRSQSAEEDSARWTDFPFREDDIVISTRSKSGTTWMQMICALLIFQTPRLPAPISELSPWFDWLVTPRDQLLARLEAQPHRRFIKTHTPLDGIPLSPLATYIVVGRHPLDMAVSLYHQGGNINRERMAELTGEPAPGPGGERKPRRELRDWLLRWIDADARPVDSPDSLAGVLWHIGDAWTRREAADSTGLRIVLVHYDELSRDLEYQMRQLAVLLGLSVPGDLWPGLVRAATFDDMRANAITRIPAPAGVLNDPVAFFRRGTSGAGSRLLTEAELAHYHARVGELAVNCPQAALNWLHQNEAHDPGRAHQAMAG
jgi:hypothetical protein